MAATTTLQKGKTMIRPIVRTPVVGETLCYLNRKDRVQLPVRIVKVWAAACEVEILAGGLFDSLKGKTLRVHVAMLHERA